MLVKGGCTMVPDDDDIYYISTLQALLLVVIFPTLKLEQEPGSNEFVNAIAPEVEEGGSEGTWN